MRKIIFLFPVAFFICIVNYSVCGSQEPGLPRLVLPEKVFNAKEVQENTVIEHTFKILNQGDGPLEIKKVKPG